MTEHSITHVGLDVHKDSTAVAVAEPGRQARYGRRLFPVRGTLRPFS
jgi:hypothetical protein